MGVKTPLGFRSVTFRGGVYDITEFIQNHPGGVDKILTEAMNSYLRTHLLTYAANSEKPVELYRVW